MGKKTRTRRAKKSRSTPYKVDKMIEDDGGETDEKIESNEKQGEAKEMVDEGENDSGEEAEQKGETKGKMIRRHNMEWKNVRLQMNELKKSRYFALNRPISPNIVRVRLKLKKKDVQQNAERKDITKQIKSLKTDMKARHQKELEAWEEEHKKK